MSWRGLFTGALALVALQAIVSSNAASGRVGDMFDHVADLVRRGLDPSVPAIPDLSGGGMSSTEADSGVSAAASSTAQPGKPSDDSQPPRRPNVQSL